jgi:cobalamin synthase
MALTLLIGGARSGKSRLAVSLASSCGALAFGSAIGIGVALVAGAASAAGIVVTVAVVTFAIGGSARRCFGGATGDVFGAAAELSQTLGLVAVVVIAGR